MKHGSIWYVCSRPVLQVVAMEPDNHQWFSDLLYHVQRVKPSRARSLDYQCSHLSWNWKPGPTSMVNYRLKGSSPEDNKDTFAFVDGLSVLSLH